MSTKMISLKKPFVFDTFKYEKNEVVKTEADKHVIYKCMSKCNTTTCTTNYYCFDDDYHLMLIVIVVIMIYMPCITN